jgi:hypothetical protein
MITASDLENRLLSVAVASPLGQAVTYTPALSGVAATIRGVLNREYIETLSETGQPVGVGTALLTVYASDLLAAPLRSDAVTVGGSNWTVGEVINDGQSAYRLRLREAA